MQKDAILASLLIRLFLQRSLISFYIHKCMHLIDENFVSFNNKNNHRIHKQCT